MDDGFDQITQEPRGKLSRGKVWLCKRWCELTARAHCARDYKTVNLLVFMFLYLYSLAKFIKDKDCMRLPLYEIAVVVSFETSTSLLQHYGYPTAVVYVSLLPLLNSASAHKL